MGETNRLVYWVKRLSEIALIGWLLLLLLIDLVVVTSEPNGAAWPSLVCGMVGIAAVLWRRSRRVNGFVALLAVSFLSSLAIGIAEADGSPGLAEIGALLVLTVGGLRAIEPVRQAALFSLAAMVVLETSCVRLNETTASVVSGFLLFVSWSFAAGIGAYFRFQQERRREAVEAVRRAERLELARELHDLVAHHITGIVVQAQAAKVVAEQKPEAVVPALEAIAGAGADALTSMRRLVGVLRAQDEAARSPGSTLMEMRTMVERFSTAGPQVAFDIGQGITDGTVAPEVMTTLHRVLQESLTNVRRHAPGTGWVEAELRLTDGSDLRAWAGSGRARNGQEQRSRRAASAAEAWSDGDAVRLRVRNYGSASDIRVSRLGGGFGLVGMAERVEALGGRLMAGPTHSGAWEVVAEFPL
ncbi:histidine kinase [Streptosporangium sp. NBC_01755]|uniref:sensor histidine kinase n=1 Tax=unclassified Streptosporangium TaxID=2632669 RepID=UPI002DD82619|nr:MULTISPECIES: histidine kinase [unclassified Streptosporangium]WSA26101.1 histidine kinase [Streptosporangium sp. NBC_01810]WSD02469.1 histidine kinase [Streptosporangium sp. NBC_01755]